MSKYKYALIDYSYIAYRNFYAISRGKKAGEYNEGDLIRSTLQTLNKLSKTWGITCDKMIMIYDKWAPEYQGYYTTYLLKGMYKDDRGDIEEAKGQGKPQDTYMTQEVYDRMKQDPNVTPEQLEEAFEQLYGNKVRYRAKWAMVGELSNFGVPLIGLEGWEFDNLAWLASGLLYDPDTKPSVIITKDSDLQYALSPKMDYFRLPTGGSEPKVITYDEMYQTIPDSLKGRLSLYDYKSYLDALGDGHNGMRKTRKDHTTPDTVIEEILDGNLSGLSDPELFKLQLSTFDISKFPRFEEAKRIVTDLFSTTGRLGSLKEFNEFKKKYGIGGQEVWMGDQFFISFISKFNPKLYS